MRYFFHIVDNGMVQKDHIGRELADDDVAIAEGRSAARYLLKTYPIGALHSLHLKVEDINGCLIATVWCRDVLGFSLATEPLSKITVG
jgi:hypothetical protein